MPFGQQTPLAQQVSPELHAMVPQHTLPAAAQNGLAVLLQHICVAKQEAVPQQILALLMQ
ncbi:hypothetical protein [Nevskia soli]|uniref:hypothetical protein n=1 Tax=Nevskia soli TaxID=418856 RepID=UPI0015D86EA1|nr:hypothetical protein [Nevskia soli]